MGAGNVKLVFVCWGDLPGGAFRLLTYMALRTKDGDREPTFWAGREDLAFALGRKIPAEGGDEESKRIRLAAFQAVKDAIGALTKSGAITNIERARPGRNAVYRLNLTPEWGRESLHHDPVDNLEMVEENPTPNGVGNPYAMVEEIPTEWGREFLPNGVGNSYPRGRVQEESGLSEGISGGANPGPDPSAHATPAPKNDQHPRFDFKGACAYLLTITGELRDAVTQQATSELGPGAKREHILVRAAHIAWERHAA